MKILQIARDDYSPGANRAAYRLHKSLQNQGINSTLLVAEKKTDDESVVTDKRYIRILLGKVTEKVINTILKKKKHSVFSHNWISAIKKEKEYYEKFDIIHLHWLGASTISLREIEKIKKPIVWRLPDMFSLTGGCHYTQGCEKFINKCNRCHLLEQYFFFDIAKMNFNKKHKVYQKKIMHIVSPSVWLYELTKKAKLYENSSKYNITTGVNTKLFSPLSQETARGLLGLDRKKKIILFGAMSSTSDPRKGFEYLHNALKK